MDTVRHPYFELDLRRREYGNFLPLAFGAEWSVAARRTTSFCGKLQSPRFQSVIAVAKAHGLRRLQIMEGGSFKFGVEPKRTQLESNKRGRKPDD